MNIAVLSYSSILVYSLQLLVYDRLLMYCWFFSAINPTSLYEVLCKVSKSSLQSIKWGKSFHKSVTEMAKKDINGLYFISN